MEKKHMNMFLKASIGQVWDLCIAVHGNYGWEWDWSSVVSYLSEWWDCPFK